MHYRNNVNKVLLGLVVVFLVSCTDTRPTSLPILGQPQIVGQDTILHRIVDFELLDHDSTSLTNASLEPFIYVADFFFTSCPTVCPKVKQQMLRIADHFADEERLRFLCHSIDYRRDSVPVLSAYAQKLQVDDRWHFVEVPENQLDSLANNYISVALEDEDAPGGFNHSANLLLVDRERHIRSFCLGTDPKDVDRFIGDIQLLLDETYP